MIKQLSENQKAALKRNIEILEMIKEAVGIYFGVEPAVLNNLKVNKHYDNIIVKQFIVYICKRLAPKISWTLLGRAIGGFDHATIIHTYDKACGYIETDKKYKMQIEEVIGILTSEGDFNSEYHKSLADLYFHVNLNDVKVVKVSKSAAIVFTGISDATISKIKMDYFIGEGNETVELVNTGLSIMSKKSKLVKK